MTPHLTLLRAAELLEEDAELVRESCADHAGNLWSCEDCPSLSAGLDECESIAAHDERLSLAAKLRLIAESAFRNWREKPKP